MRYFPVGLDVFHLSAAPGEVAHRMGSDGDVVALAPDAQEVGDEQVVQVSHHKVVHRGAMLRVPLLCQRGMPQLNLIAVAGHVVVVEHLVKQLLLAVMDEGTKEVAVTDVTSGQTVTMCVDFVDELLQHGLAVTNRYEVHLQCNGLCALAACGITMCFGVVEFADECGLDAVGTWLTHQLVPPVVVGGRHQRHRGVLRKACTSRSVVVPVAQTLFQYIAGVLCGEVVDVAFHLRPIAGDEFVVTIESAIEERQGNDGATPFR